jgi:sugar phosphate isomerase/epimerase
MNRKDFIKTTALFGASLGLSNSILANAFKTNKISKIGVQLWSLPKLLESNFEQTIQQLAEIGIKELELYGPFPFSDPREKTKWAGLASLLGFSASGYFGKTPEHFFEVLKSNQLKAPSIHTDLFTLESNMSALGKAARQLNSTYVVLPAIPEEFRPDLKGYGDMAKRFNEIGRMAKEEGIRFAYHNHGYGLQAIDGTVPLDIILKETDPDLVFFEMDVFWTIAGKANPMQLLNDHVGRYKMLHLKDMKSLTYFKSNGSNPDEWVELFPQLVPAGEGVLPLNDILRVAHQTGVEHYFIEQDLAPNPIADINSAYSFISNVEL